MRAGYCQTIRLRKSDDRLIILFRWTELFGELRRCQIMAVIGTGRIANLPEQVGERFPVAQRQSYGQIQPVRARKTPNGQ